MTQQSSDLKHSHIDLETFNLNICKPAVYFTGPCGATHVQGESCAVCCIVDQEMYATHAQETAYAYNLFHKEHCDNDDYDEDDYESSYDNDGDIYDSNVQSNSHASEREIKDDIPVLNLTADQEVQPSKSEKFISKLKLIFNLRKALISNQTSA